MKIALDVQSLFEERKTGIGWMIKMLVSHVICDTDDEYQLNYFAFRKKNEKQVQMSYYQKDNTTIQCCGWMPLAIYSSIWKYIPLPYSGFFQKKADVTIFFNYFIPPGVKGKKATFIYDMVWKACPETMDSGTKRFMDQNVEVACKRADVIFTISEFSKWEIMKYMNLPSEKVRVVYGGIDQDCYHINHPIDEIEGAKARYHLAEDYFLYLGTLEPRKNIPRLIEAYALLCQEEENVPKMVIAGKKGWQYEPIFQLVKELELEEQVIFTGYVPDEDVPLLMAGALAFVFPSLYEGFGLPPLEAMACGTPVIVSDAASLPEVVGDAGLQVSPYDIKEIKEAMNNIMKNQELRRELRDAGIARSQKFFWSNNAEMLRTICHQIVTGQE